MSKTQSVILGLKEKEETYHLVLRWRGESETEIRALGGGQGDRGSRLVWKEMEKVKGKGY